MTTPPKLREFVWNELVSSNPAAADAFYTRVFGWESRTVMLDGVGPYTIWLKDGVTVAGMVHGAQQNGQHSGFWGSYVSVPDVDQAAQAVIAAGGSVKVMPINVPELGRIALVADPTGALFSLITPLVPVT